MRTMQRNPRAARYYWPNGERVEATRLTLEQEAALEKLIWRWDLNMDLTIHPGPGQCVMVQVGNFWIGVETNGYTHT